MPYKPNPEARGVSRKTDGEGPGAEDHVMEGQHRVIDRWQRGDEGPNGWTESLIVRVRSEDVNPILEDTQSEAGVHWVPKPPPGMTAGLHVLLANPNKAAAKMPMGARLVDALALPNGQAVFVMAGQYTPSPAALESLTAARQQATHSWTSTSSPAAASSPTAGRPTLRPPGTVTSTLAPRWPPPAWPRTKCCRAFPRLFPW